VWLLKSAPRFLFFTQLIVNCFFYINGSCWCEPWCRRAKPCIFHEISIALQADDMLILQHGRLIHQGACTEAATHLALEQVFEHRVRVAMLEGQWLAVPRIQGLES
jgi:hypothetical protein